MKAVGSSKSSSTLCHSGCLSGSPCLPHMRATLRISRNLLRLQYFQRVHLTLRRVPSVPADGVTLVAPRRRPRADSMWVTQLTVDILLARLILALSSGWNRGSHAPHRPTHLHRRRVGADGCPSTPP